MGHTVSKEQTEFIECDGRGKTFSSDKKSLIQVFIKVRKDSQIPEFDAITDFKIYSEAMEEFERYHSKLAELLNDMGGMFIEDALKLKDADVFSALGEELSRGECPSIPGLKALKKAILDYFQNTEQTERARKATTSVVCFCRHVSNYDIEQAVKNGHDTFERVQVATAAGTGCGSCINKTKELVDQYRKTSIGKISDSIPKK